MRELAKVFDNPRRQIDPVNHELALNWLREKYNEKTAKELAESVWQWVWRWVKDGLKFTPAFIKKRRERLGLTTKRPSGPRPNPTGRNGALALGVYLKCFEPNCGATRNIRS
jgi:hypothetical protein